MITDRMGLVAMVEALDRLRLAQILLPAFPIGSFAHSQGLEVAIARGLVADEASLSAWIAAVLRYGVGRMDALFVSLARRPGADLGELVALYEAYCPSEGRAREAAELGRGFQAMLGEAQALPYPLAVGHATRAMVLPEAEILALWFQGIAAQLASVAVRLMPLGQGAAQRVIAALAPLMAELATGLTELGPDDLCSFALGADMASVAQETLEVRIFRS